MSLSTLRPPISLSSPSPRSLLTLTDDSLLLLFTYLSVPQCIALLTTSRRIYQLLRQTVLPAIRAILMPSLVTYGRRAFGSIPPFPAVTFSRRRYRRPPGSPALQWPLLFSANQRANEGHLDQRKTGRRPPFCRQRLALWSPSLPALLPNLQSLTFRCSFEDHLTGQLSTENRLLSGYLQSPWSQSLLSLHLVIHLGNKVSAEQTLLGHLNGLVALEHLTFTFQGFSVDNDGVCTPDNYLAILPDTLPVLGQLHSFSLHDYYGERLVCLLKQLGPCLSFLSVSPLHCTATQFGDFLRGHPTYRTGLTTLDLSPRSTGEQPAWDAQALVPLAVQYLPSLERLFYFPYAKCNIFSSVDSLLQLSRLRELHVLSLRIAQLRDHSSSGHSWRQSFPRLSSLRRLSLRLEFVNWEPEKADDTLLDRTLPLLEGAFPAVEELKLMFYNAIQEWPLSTDPFTIQEAHLSQQLTGKVRRHWPSVRQCRLRYTAQVGNEHVDLLRLFSSDL